MNVIPLDWTNYTEEVSIGTKARIYPCPIFIVRVYLKGIPDDIGEDGAYFRNVVRFRGRLGEINIFLVSSVFTNFRVFFSISPANKVD